MIDMPKKSVKVSKIHKAWEDLKKDKRSKYNSKYNKTGKKDITLATSIKFMETGSGGDIEIVFQDDVTDEEVNKVLEIVENVIS